MRRIALLAAVSLAFPATARADLVSPSHDAAALAVARNGAPYVAYLTGCSLHVARRAADGWHDVIAVRCLPLAPNAIYLAGARVDAHGRLSVLAFDTHGSTVVLVRQTASGFRAQTVVRISQPGSVLGPPGLALDAHGSPVVAYAIRRAAHDATFLRIARVGRGGALVATPITRGGGPAATVAPSAAPVLVRGRVHVVETFASEAIEWSREHGRWVGQYLFASLTGAAVGPVFAAAVGGSTWIASTLLQPEFGESDVLLTLRAATETTVTLFAHAQVSALAIANGRPEVAANEAVRVGDEIDTAALVADAAGSAAELDGRIDGYAAGPGGTRQILLSTDGGIEWFSSPARPNIAIELRADESGTLSGRVPGVRGGTVELFREPPGAPRVLAATVALAADGSFTAQDLVPTSPTLFRAVYRDPETGIPYASLTKTPVG